MAYVSKGVWGVVAAVIVVAAALSAYYLGAFRGIGGGSAFTTTVQEGGSTSVPSGVCMVSRPGGPYSVANIQLSGSCNGAVPSKAAYFNGMNASINVTVPLSPSISVVLWARSNTSTWSNYGWLASAREKNGFIFDPINNDKNNRVQFYLDDYNGTLQYVGTLNPAVITSWNQYGLVYNASSKEAYLVLNGNYSGPFSVNMTRTSGMVTVTFGYDAGSGSYGKGMESNVQIYNTSISKADAAELYHEGMGGAPVQLQNLVAWYPLNGNANDYSGNNNNGVLVGGANFTTT